MKPSRPARILEVTSYPPPRAGWGIRVEFLKKRFEAEGHECVVLNIGTSRNIPSPEYEMVLGGGDFVRKVWRYARQGFTVHAHANGDALKGLLLAIAAELIGLCAGRRCFLTFHAGVIQRYFPLNRSWRMAPLFWLLFLIPKRIICNSEPVKAKIRGYGVAAHRIVPIAAFSKQYLEYQPTPLPDNAAAFLSAYRHVLFTYVRMRPLFYPVVMVDGLAAMVKANPGVGLIVCGGGAGHQDPGVWDEVQARIREHGIEQHICMVDDLDHDAFLTLLGRCAVYLRTPITDGVASSVLESLALRVPVVACDNGTRPAGVVTYIVDDAADMARQVLHVLEHHAEFVARLEHVDLPDTVADELRLLTAQT